MARREKPAAHENQDRWLVSYADFITLLFAFFVVMFASSQADKTKAARVSEAVKEALQNTHLPKMVAEILGGAVDEKGRGNAQMRGPGGSRNTTAPNEEIREKMVELTPSLQHLSKELEADIKAGKIQISLEPRGLVVTLREAAYFPSGNDTVAPETYPSLEKVAEAIKQLPNPVRMEGHTDSIPIHNTRFRSNWELSAARAIAVRELFEQQMGLPRDRMAIAGYADTAPVSSNDTPEHRALNRRVDVIVLNQYGLKSEPSQEAAQTPAGHDQKPATQNKTPGRQK